MDPGMFRASPSTLPAVSADLAWMILSSHAYGVLACLHSAHIVLHITVSDISDIRSSKCS